MYVEHVMKRIEFELTEKERAALFKIAKAAGQTPNELAHDVVVMWIVKEQAKERP
jgi:hypothetical protein